MKTFIPFGLVLNVQKCPTEGFYRCQLCHEFAGENDIIITNNGDERMPFLFNIAHLACFERIVRSHFNKPTQGSLNVHVTQKITGSGPKVDLTVGIDAYTFEPANALTLGIALIMASTAVAFDTWALGLINEEGLPGLEVLKSLRVKRSKRSVDASIVANTAALLEDCWSMLREVIEAEFGVEAYNAGWRKKFEETFTAAAERPVM